MMEFTAYPKIDSIFKRDDTGRFTEEYSCPEFEYLSDNEWEFTEKIDGTNIRIGWDGENVRIGGRTDKAQIPTFLIDVLNVQFTPKVFDGFDEVILYGEGYGPKIQKGGKYRDTPGFILFDVRIGRWWLKREDVAKIAQEHGIDFVPEVARGTLGDAIGMVKEGYTSHFGDFVAEGLVLKPRVDLLARSGQRVITKVKHRDFRFDRA